MQQIKDLQAKKLAPGLTGYYAHGTSMTFGLVEIKAGSTLPSHNHCPLSTGLYYGIPSNVVHSAIAVTDCKVIDVFNPVREDYKK